MRDRWVGVGWFCSREHLERVLHARWKVCVFWAAIIHVLSYILFCHDLLLHVVFCRRHRKTFDVFFFLFGFCSNNVFCFFFGGLNSALV